MIDIMELPRGERLISLYQYLPRGECNAKSLTELLKFFNPTGEKAKSRAKLLEQDLLALFSLLGETAIVRIPSWSAGTISGKTPKYYINPNHALGNFDNENLFFWEMLDKFTANFLPKTIHQTLEQKISTVRDQHQKQYQASELGKWKNHLITLPSVLQAPHYDSQILAAIHQAILSQKALQFDYRKKWESEIETKTLYPVGLVFIDNMVYLTGFYTIGDSPTLSEKKQLGNHRNFALTRIYDAQVTDEPIPNWVENYSLDKLQKMGKLEIHVNDKPELIQLKLKINAYACDHLRERPLSDDQIIEPFDANNKLLTAKVMNTGRLEEWLIAMSQLSEVIEPSHIRENVIERLKAGLSQYASK